MRFPTVKPNRGHLTLEVGWTSLDDPEGQFNLLVSGQRFLSLSADFCGYLFLNLFLIALPWLQPSRQRFIVSFPTGLF
jgi:hypothetical protein